MQLGDYEVVDSGKGWCSVKQKSSGETMHSVSDPTEESRRLYVEQTRLAERLRETSSPPLVVWDVGLGAAHNAMAVVRCFEETLRARGVEHTRGMELVSFERDLDPLRLAQKFSGRFAHLHHSAPSTLLQKARWEDPSGLLRWTLHEGCFLEMMESAPAPDLVLYDPFSSKTDAPLWAHTVFERIVRACQGKETLLVTYSNSTAVRASLLWAGFFVGAGVATGPKSETTLAMTRAQGNLLGEAWLKRFEKSSAKFPASVEQAQWENFAERVRGHPQCSGKFTS
jgi:queuine tRNA-ribosyltransferase